MRDDLISRQDIKWHDYLVAGGNGMYHNEKVAFKSKIDDLPPAQLNMAKRFIDADFEEAHYTSILYCPTPDVTESDRNKARVILDFLRMAKTVEPKTGKWIEKSTNGEPFSSCSICGYIEWDAPRNFCPNCGADMRGEEE